MKCSRCSKPAILHITESAAEEQFEELHLCEDCWRKYEQQFSQVEEGRRRTVNGETHETGAEAMDQLDALIQPRLRVLQIIALALIAGLAVFAGIAVVVVHTQGRQANAAWATPVLSYTAVGYLVSAVLAWAGFPRGLETGQVARIADGPPNPLANRPGQSFGGPANDQAQLLAVRHTSTIVALAILEGAGFLGCIAYLLEGQWYALAVVGVVLLLMLATFPTQSGVRHWIEKQMGVLEDRRRAS